MVMSSVGPLSSCTNVWLGPISIGTLVVKGLTYKFVDESPALNETSPDTKFHVNWHYGYWVT